MTSVPRLPSTILRDDDSNQSSDRELNGTSNIQIKAALPAKLLEIRHIRSVFMKRIKYKVEKIDEPECNQNRYTEELDCDISLEQDKEHLKPLRKGKSSNNLKKSYNDNDKKSASIYFKDDNYLNRELQNSKHLLNMPSQIQQQLDSQKLNNDTFCECMYTINNFLDIEHPYFISRVFSSHVDIEDELDLHIFDNSATFNLYVKSNTNPWFLLRQYHIKLSLLVNLGDDLRKIEKFLFDVDNLLLLKLSDECYYMLPDSNISPDIPKVLKNEYTERTLRKVESFYYKQQMCSYDQIMTMNNYSRCIHDLRNTKLKLDSRINIELNKRDVSHQLVDKKTTYETSLGHLEIVIGHKIKHNNKIEAKILKLKERRDFLKRKIEQLKNPPILADSEKIDIATQTTSVQMENETIELQVNLEKAKISSVIQYIFPIEDVNNDHKFSLFQTCFPSSLIPRNSIYSIHNPDELTIIPISTISNNIIQRLTQISKSQCERLNSLIGYISLIIVTIADIFRISLRYPIRFLGSTTYINDYISKLQGSNSEQQMNNNPVNQSTSIYPLFICQNATLAIKFTYGLLLLRKDLEQLFEVEKIVKIDEFNLLTACKIWLICVEGYSDIVSYGGNLAESEDDTIINLDSSKDFTISDQPHEESPNFSIILNDDNNTSNNTEEPISQYRKKRVTFDHSNKPSYSNTFSNISIHSKLSRKSTVSGISAVSAVSNASSIVTDYNNKLLSEERIKHIKKHLLKGTNGKA